MMFVGFIAGLVAVVIAFAGVALVALMGASASGLIPSTTVVGWMKGRVADGMRVFWLGIGVSAGLVFGALGWWMLSTFAGGDVSVSRFAVAAVVGSIVGWGVAWASFETGRKLLGKIQVPATTSR
jgi:hypothetical protein